MLRKADADQQILSMVGLKFKKTLDRVRRLAPKNAEAEIVRRLNSDDHALGSEISELLASDPNIGRSIARNEDSVLSHRFFASMGFEDAYKRTREKDRAKLWKSLQSMNVACSQGRVLRETFNEDQVKEVGDLMIREAQARGGKITPSELQRLMFSDPKGRAVVQQQVGEIFSNPEKLEMMQQMMTSMGVPIDKLMQMAGDEEGDDDVPDSEQIGRAMSMISMGVFGADGKPVSGRGPEESGSDDATD